MPRARCQIARHIIKYTTPRAVGNIMFSPDPPPLSPPWPFHLQQPGVPTVHPPTSPPSPLFPFSSSFLTPALPSRFANKFARRTAVVLTSRRFRRPLPEIHFSVGRDIMSPRCNGETVHIHVHIYHGIRQRNLNKKSNLRVIRYDDLWISVTILLFRDISDCACVRNIRR